MRSNKKIIRYEAHSGGEREIQRTMLELLNQLDGFDAKGDVKVIMATNRIDSLDPALIRPGRIDRKIELPAPDVKSKRRIFNIHTSKMTLDAEVDLEEFIMTKDDLSGADIKAMCTEAGLLALRDRRMKVTQTGKYSLSPRQLFHFRPEKSQGQSPLSEKRQDPRRNVFIKNFMSSVFIQTLLTFYETIGYHLWIFIIPQTLVSS